MNIDVIAVSAKGGRRRSSLRVLGGAAAVVAAVSGSLLVASPASAAPGDAAAIGAAGEIVLTLGDRDFSRAVSVGDVATATPGEDADTQSDVVLLDAGFAELSVASSETASESTLQVSRAASEIGVTSFDFLGESVVSLDSAAAAASCTYGETAEAEVELGELRILGIPVTVNETIPVAEQTVVLGDEVQLSEDPTDVVDLSGVELTVSVAQLVVADETGGVAISLAVAASLTGTHGTQQFADEVVASLVLASALCETPSAPVAVSGIDPATGPVAGGQQVTITGSGFTPETAVRFGEVAATDVVVDSSGTSLTATTPAASAAGDVTVTVSRPDGSSAALAYSYTAAAPVVPVPARLPAVLAATGSDAVGSLPWLGGVLLLGGLAMSVSTRRAHRRS
jgi:hypothetical protein